MHFRNLQDKFSVKCMSTNGSKDKFVAVGGVLATIDVPTLANELCLVV